LENKLKGFTIFPSICSQAALVSHISNGINGLPVSQIPINERIEYYLGDTFNKPLEEPRDYKVGYDVPIKISWDVYKQNHKLIHPNTAYAFDVIRYLNYSKNKELWFQCGDSSYTHSNFPVLVKTRDTTLSEAKGIIVNLDSLRHSFDISNYDVPWEQKKSDVVWRGADTSRGTRLQFVKKYYKTKNIGFVKPWVQDGINNKEYIDEYVKDKLPIHEMLKYKYLPVVDGNDKSSSLGWVLSSNSVPLMPKPRFHSWICEKFLIDGFHYVRLKDDFSDLDEKINWCKTHDEECKKIALEGKRFMSQFLNKNTENYIEQQLINNLNKLNIGYSK
jgi:hypothetical protein